MFKPRNIEYAEILINRAPSYIDSRKVDDVQIKITADPYYFFICRFLELRL